MPTPPIDPRLKRASDAAARALADRIVRFAYLTLGGLVVVAGIVIAPLPGPMGLPIVVVGLMLILRNSFAARRQFVRFQRSHPKIARPIRRLLRRDPEVIQMFWAQLLRVERLLVPARWRVCVKSRRALKRRPGIA